LEKLPQNLFFGKNYDGISEGRLLSTKKSAFSTIIWDYEGVTVPPQKSHWTLLTPRGGGGTSAKQFGQRVGKEPDFAWASWISSR
jgi:hypothetical protein